MIALEIFAVAAVAIGSGAQAISGIGFALMCAPLLTLALGVHDGVRAANALGVVINAVLVCRYRHGVEPRHVLLLLVPAAITVPLVAIPVGHANVKVLSVVAGAAILLAVLALLMGARIHSLRGGVGAVLAGIVSGAMNVIGGVGGAAVATYAANASWEPTRLRPTFAVYFFFLGIVSVASLGLPDLSDGLWLAMVLAIVGGLGIGFLIAKRMSASGVLHVVLGLSAAGAIAAIVQGLR